MDPLTKDTKDHSFKHKL